ncbi:hypothetical protein EJB05_06467 [Eragrostis curvula]|uniref:HMA domain-containing protein n=1 Tax=Eragrostis curvula TaxID=38414 RepID=A0A5J9WHY3_9POAL|nr:hypothetical protein EJB05_06467 [Eragrostis curvula]
MSQEIVLQVDAVGDACRAKAMNAVAHLHGVNSMKFDGEKLTVVGDVDVVCVVNKLKKAMFSPVVLSVGPVKAAKVQEKAPETPKKNPPCCEGCRCGCRLPPSCGCHRCRCGCHLHPSSLVVICWDE